LGHKVHPIGFRIGVIRDWQAKWYSDKHYAEFLQEDAKLRQAIKSKYTEAGISLVEIDRQANKVSITIHTARPGVVIGRGGQRVNEMRHFLEDLIGKGIQLNIEEIRQPELDAYLVARAVAEQIERRVAYLRVMKQTIFRTIQAGAKGARISCAGRLGGAEIARRGTMHQGRVPLHTLRADIDYGFTEACTALGRIGVKVWIYKGDILPEAKVIEVEEIPDELAASESAEVTLAIEPEEKPAEPAPDISAETAPSAKAEEKPDKSVVSRRRRLTPTVEPEEKPAEPAPDISAEATPSVEAEDKPAEPAVRRKRRSTPAAKSEEKPAESAPTASVEQEGDDVTTQAGEISQST